MPSAHGCCRIHALRQVIACLGCLAAVRRPAVAEQADPPRPDIPALCKRVKPAFVFIGGGSGAIVSPNGWMLTNSPRGRRAQAIRRPHGRRPALPRQTARPRRERRPGRAATGIEAQGNGALPGDRRFRRPCTSATMPWPWAIPSPKGCSTRNPTFTLGVISALNQTIDTDAELIATDAAVNPGNSGGPLIDMAGHMVGINGQIATRWGLRSNTGLGYAISARQIRLWLPRLAQANGGDVPHGRLSGVEFETSEEVGLESPQDRRHRAWLPGREGGLQDRRPHCPLRRPADHQRGPTRPGHPHLSPGPGGGRERAAGRQASGLEAEAAGDRSPANWGSSWPRQARATSTCGSPKWSRTRRPSRPG